MIRRLLTRRDDDGITTLEVMILFPAVFMFMMFAIQAAMYHYSRQVVLAAVGDVQVEEPGLERELAAGCVGVALEEHAGIETCDRQRPGR